MDERFQRLQDDVDIGINYEGGNTKTDREFKTKILLGHLNLTQAT
jgi:hypothetical protein